MRRIVFLSAIVVASLLSFYGCDKENHETKDPKIETLSAEKGGFCVVSLTGCVSGLEGVALDFECGIEYSIDPSFAEDKTTRQRADKKYSEDAYTITITNVVSGQRYYYRAYYISQLMIYYGEVKDFIFTWDIPQVDLGLSVRWATFNVGATKPEEYGDYFAWGETEPRSTYYGWVTYKWCNGSSYDLTKYCYKSYYGNNGFTDTKTTLDLEDDVAHVKWGGNWRMPTKAEQDDLRNKCTWTWYSSGNTEFNGVAGYKVTSTIEGYTDRSIFLPAAGYRYGTVLYSVGGDGNYWSSSLGTDGPGYACSLCFNSDSVDWYGNSRSIGQSVRPVCPSEEWFSSVSISFVEDSRTMLVGGSAMLNVTVKQNDEVCDNSLIVWTSDNPSVAVVNENGVVTALSAGTAKITVSIQSVSAQCTITVTDDESKVIHEFVDLGLSVKWGIFNVGATKPEDCGGYYAWGETETKSSYTWTNYKFRTSGDSYDNVKFSKYNNSSSYGPIDNKTTLDLEDDVAHVKWGGSWRMPTKAEQDELRDNCTWKWYSSGNTEFNGVAGYKVTSNKEGYNDRFIFLPAAGCRRFTDFDGIGYDGGYWSSLLYTDGPDVAYYLYFGSDGVNWIRNRDVGQSVRPVCE